MNPVLVELIGDKLDLDDLQTVMTGSSWEILCEEDRYYLTSPALDKPSDKKESIRLAKQHIETLNGIANIIHHDHQNVQVGEVKTPSEGGQQPYAMVTNKAASGQQENPDEIEFAKLCLAKAAAENQVLKVVHQFNDITWSSLQSIYDTISRGMGGQNGLYRVADKNRINDFVKTLQHTRQTKPGGKKPENPVTLYQGNRLMKELFRKWIAQERSAPEPRQPAREAR